MTEAPTPAPDVTVIIATLNRRAWLAEAVASVRAQTGVTWELIIVNSTQDDALSWLASLGDPRVSGIQWPEPAERGIACNAALAQARGARVMFLDDDDQLEPGALASLLRALSSAPGAVAAVGARRDWYVAANRRRRDAHPRRRLRRAAFDDFLFGWSAVSGQNLYSTEVIRQVGGYDTSIAIVDDRDLWLRVARLGPIAICPSVVMTYRIHDEQRRPANLARLRDDVARRAIARLPREDRRRGLLIRRSAAQLTGAEHALRERRPIRAAALVARAMALPPWPWRSPLLRPWTAQRLAYATWAGIHPWIRR